MSVPELSSFSFSLILSFSKGEATAPAVDASSYDWLGMRRLQAV